MVRFQYYFIIGSENYSGMRVIRKEEGKQAEVFSLIIKSTMEESWFKKSSKNLASIEINEEELIALLKGEELTAFVKRSFETLK